MKSKRQVLALCLASSLILGTLAGCTTSDTGTNNSTTNNSTTGQDTGNTSEELMTITFWGEDSTGMLPDSYCETLIESKFPVDIQVNRTDNEEPSRVVDLLTENKVPDVFWIKASTTYMEKLDLTRPIPREMVEEYAPSFIEKYDSYPTLYTSIVDMENTENFFALSGITEQSAVVANSLYADFYRYDWIQALDIDLGVNVTQISDNFYIADKGLTLEKFEEVMHGFTYGDPDGNGIDDTFGGTFEYSVNTNRFDLLYSGFDLVHGINEFNGEAEQFYVTDDYKEFVIWFADMFSKGYFDEDFYSQSVSDRREKVNQEEAGYFLESSIAINSWASGRPPLSLIEANPEATFLITSGLTDNDGESTIIKSAMPTTGQLCYINKNVSDEKLAMILQILEYISFGEDNISFWFGEENVDWTYDEDGRVEVINNLQASEKGSRIFTYTVMVDELFHAISVEPIFEAGADFWLGDGIWRKNGSERYEYKLDLLGETDYDELILEYSGICSLIAKEYFEDWVYNGLDIEDSWEDYLQALDEAGYNIMMDELDNVEPLDEMILQFISE